MPHLNSASAPVVGSTQVGILAASHVTVELLDAHLRNRGLQSFRLLPESICFRTEIGIGYRVTILTDHNFLRVHTYLPLNHLALLTDKRELAQRLNDKGYLPTFSVDRDGDLEIAYVLPYTHGLITDNLTVVIERFASLLEFIVHTDSSGLIDFGRPEAASEERLH